MASSSERNRVLSITMRMIDQMTPVTNFLTNRLIAMKNSVVKEVGAMAKPWIAFGVQIYNALKPSTLLSKALQVMLGPIRAVGAALNGMTTLATRALNALIHPIQTVTHLLHLMTDPLTVIRSLIVFEIGAKIWEIVHATAEMGAQLEHLSQKLGMSVEDLSVLRHAAVMTDTDMEALARGFKEFSVRVTKAGKDSGAANSYLEQMHITLRNVDGTFRPTMDLFADVADGFQNMAAGINKTGAATALFGKGGMALLPILNLGRGGMKQMADETERAGVMFNEVEAEMSLKMVQSLHRLSESFVGVRNAIALSLMPILTELFDSLSAWVSSNRPAIKVFANEVAASITFMVHSMQAAVELIKKLAADQSGARALGETFQAMAKFAVDAIRDGAIAAFQTINNVIQIMAGPILTGVGLLASEIGQKLRAGILSPFVQTDEEILSALKDQRRRLLARNNLFEGDPNPQDLMGPKSAKMFDDLTNQITEMEAKIAGPIKSVQENIGLAFQKVIADMKTDVGDIADAMHTGTTAISADFDAMVNKIKFAGGQLVPVFKMLTNSGIPFFELKPNPQTAAFIDQIAALKTEYLAAMDAAKNLHAEEAHGGQHVAKGTTETELALDDSAIENNLAKQAKFAAMMKTGRKRLIAEEIADWQAETRALEKEWDERAIDGRTFYMGIQALDAEHHRKMLELNGSFSDGFKKQAQDTWDDLKNQYKNGAEAASEVIDGMVTGFQNAFGAIVDGTKTVGEAFKEMGKEILNIIAKIIAKQIALFVVSQIFAGGAAATGGAISGGHFRRFAKGGVLNQPTLFRSNEGPVLAGEAGDEAFLPLKRDPRSGELSVRAVGHGKGESNVFQISFHFPDVIDAEGMDRAMVRRAKTIEDIVIRAVHTKSSMRQAIRAA